MPARTQDVADLERRCQAAELRHQELTSKMPEATRPLLRQIEAMQATADAQADAWAAAERTLNARITDAESRAAMAVERERLTSERTQVWTVLFVFCVFDSVPILSPCDHGGCDCLPVTAPAYACLPIGRFFTPK